MVVFFAFNPLISHRTVRYQINTFSCVIFEGLKACVCCVQLCRNSLPSRPPKSPSCCQIRQGIANIRQGPVCQVAASPSLSTLGISRNHASACPIFQTSPACLIFTDRLLINQRGDLVRLRLRSELPDKSEMNPQHQTCTAVARAAFTDDVSAKDVAGWAV